MTTKLFTGSPKRVEKDLKDFLQDEKIVITHMIQSSAPSSFNMSDICITIVYTLKDE